MPEPSRADQDGPPDEGRAARPERFRADGRKTIKGVGYQQRVARLAAVASFQNGLPAGSMRRPPNAGTLSRAAPSSARQQREARAAATSSNNAANARDQLMKKIAADVATLAKNSQAEGGL